MSSRYRSQMQKEKTDSKYIYKVVNDLAKITSEVNKKHLKKQKLEKVLENMESPKMLREDSERDEIMAPVFDKNVGQINLNRISPYGQTKFLAARNS